jgi:hypothetical protein
MFDTRLEKSLRASDFSDGTSQMCSQMVGGFVGAVGQVPLAVCPDVFNRIKFRGIAGKAVGMEAFIFFQERLNIRSFMNGTTIPYKNHVFSQMPQQISEKANDLMSRDVVGVESDIKAESSASRRDGKSANGRDLLMAVTMAEDWCLARRSPCLTDKRYEQEPAFVQECQVGPKFSGFFLYWAKSCFSILQWPSRFAAKPVSPASGSSSQNCGVRASRLRHGYSLCCISSVLVLKYASASICRWHDLLMRHLAATFSSNWLFAARLAKEAVPTGLGSEFPFGLFPDRSETIVRLNLRMLSASPLRGGRFCLNAA